MNESNRVITFSIKPQDTLACGVIDRLKSHCKKRGLSFSKVVIDALLHYVESGKIELDGTDYTKR